MPWPWAGPPCVLRVVIVNRKDDPATSLRGVLWRTRGPWLELREAALLAPGVAPTPLDGEIVIHTDNVAFIQAI